MIGVVLDTNIIVSAYLNENGHPFRVLKLALAGAINLCAETAAARIQIVQALPCQWTVGINDGRRLANNSIALAPMPYQRLERGAEVTQVLGNHAG